MHLPGLSQGCSTQRIVEGKPIGSFYLWEWAGYNDDGISTFYRYDGKGNRILDANGNPEVTTEPGQDDRIYMGNAQPKLTMGWNNNVTWKNWDLNVFFTGVFGQKIFNEPHAYFSYVASISTGKNVMASVMEDRLATDALAHYPSQRYLENGSYFKTRHSHYRLHLPQLLQRMARRRKTIRQRQQPLHDNQLQRTRS